MSVMKPFIFLYTTTTIFWASIRLNYNEMTAKFV